MSSTAREEVVRPVSPSGKKTRASSGMISARDTLDGKGARGMSRREVLGCGLGVAESDQENAGEGDRDEGVVRSVDVEAASSSESD